MNVFPKDTRLSFDNRSEYEDIVKRFPPYSDLAFPTLMVWWNYNDELKVSRTTNDNLVINYHIPNDPINSGLSLVGTDNIDDDIQRIFNHLKATDRKETLVHVPEFTVKAISNTGKLKLIEEIDYNEYIVPTSNLCPIESIRSDERRKIKRFLESVTGHLSIRSLDLNDEANRDLLLSNAYNWWRTNPSTSDDEGSEMKVMEKSLLYASVFGTQNICLFDDDVLIGFVTYNISHDGKYFIGAHLKAKRLPYILDYLEHLVAQEAAKQGVELLNVEMDLGLPGLRTHKLGLRPVDFFRKYTITPA
jgi:hypothetical protein